MRTLFLVFLFFAIPLTANAELCGTWQEMKEALADQYEQYPASHGIVKDTDILRLYRTESGSTWTIVHIKPNGISCVVASGTDWEDREPKNPGDPA